MNSFIDRYQEIRQFSRIIAEPLSAEDCAIQSMPDASPTRWHLAHTTWFFETFLLKPVLGYQSFHPQFETLFNSYYNSVGEQFPRNQRGLISRPGFRRTLEYREHVDAAVMDRFADASLPEATQKIFEIGLQHEQQHQELMLTDIKHALSLNPLKPVYREVSESEIDCAQLLRPASFDFDGGLVEVGHEGGGFCFDNEIPRHRVFLQPFSISNRLVTNAEYLRFMDEGGYSRPEFWLSAGWAVRQENRWDCPLYWQKDGNDWSAFTLAGPRPIVENEPVSHVSYFEADAYARWAGHRLPTEFEWEYAVAQNPAARERIVPRWSDESIEADLPVHPQPSIATDDDSRGLNAFGNVWEWTASQYSAYPGYRPPDGALGEYNGKFMCNQFVLRGGSCATPSGHIRGTYRNFFPPDARWQFNGLRLARLSE